MKRKATRFLALAMSAVLVTSLTACGDGSDENAKDAVTPVEAQPMLSELELEILNLETKYNKGEFTQEDYLSLADAYNRAGYIRKQRDMLEQDYRLYADEEAFAALQELSVNLEEETEGIRSRAQEMQNDLELTEYLSESVNLIDSEDWFTTMMPKLKEGQRNYYLERDSQPLLYVQTGYTEEGQCFSRVWYTGNDTKRFLSQEGATIRLVTVTAAGTDENIADPAETENPDATQETGTTEARARENTTTEISDTTAPLADTPETMKDWNGTFEAWSVDSATGSITHEQGTMQGGVLTGDYTCDVHTGEGALDIYSLWNNREGMEYITYTGSFDSEGKILTEQPSEEIKKKLLEGTDYTDLILYAYDATGENCLWQGIGGVITAEEYRFGGEMIGLETRPEYTSYEVTEDMTAENNANTADGTGAATDGGENGNAADNTTGAIDSDTPQIRIFDGEVQWFDGKYWVSAGAVREMAKQDPFAAYEENHDTTASGSITGSITGKITGSADGNSTAGNDGQTITGSGTVSGDKTGGSIQKPAATQNPGTTPKPTTKPAATKPAVTPTPAPTPAPTPEPAQDDDDDDDDDSGSSDSGSSDSGSNDSGSSDSGSSGGDSGGSDVDMDWTPDLL